MQLSSRSGLDGGSSWLDGRVLVKMRQDAHLSHYTQLKAPICWSTCREGALDAIPHNGGFVGVREIWSSRLPHTPKFSCLRQSSSAVHIRGLFHHRSCGLPGDMTSALVLVQ
eukprot:1706406-Amphidinium_carterae.1